MRDPIRGGDPSPRAQFPSARVREAWDGAELSTGRGPRPVIQPLRPADSWHAWTDAFVWALGPEGVDRG